MSAEKYDSEAKTLLKAIQDKDEKAVIALCLRTTNDDRLKILNAYKDLYNQDLLGNFKNIFKDNFLKTLIALFTEPIEYDVNELKEAINTKNVDTLIEIIASRPQEILKQIKDKYNNKYKSDLIKDVKSKTSGVVEQILISLLECKRSTNEHPNEDQIKKIAEELLKAGEGQIIFTDKPVFIKYFCCLSPEEFKQLDKEYREVNYYHHTIYRAIEKKFDGDEKNVLLTVARSNINPSLYYAIRACEALDNSNNNILIRVLVSRSDKDMAKINDSYKEYYKKEFYETVKEKIKNSGDYRALILGIIDK